MCELPLRLMEYVGMVLLENLAEYLWIELLQHLVSDNSCRAQTQTFGMKNEQQNIFKKGYLRIFLK